MAQSNAEQVRICVAERRARARELGLCAQCCKQEPSPGRAICGACITAAVERTRRRRKKGREAAKFRYLIAAHEEAGDLARDHHLYQEAMQQYQDALNIDVIVPTDHVRISEKLAYAIFLSGNPNAAKPLFDRILTSYMNTPADITKTVGILLQQASQLSVDAREESALPLLAQAIHIAKTNGNSRDYALANIKMADFLMGLCRYKEAEPFLNTAEHASTSDDLALQTAVFLGKGNIAAVFGRATEAFECFERAATAAKKSVEVFQLVNVWSVYGYWAAELGNIEFKKACVERALLVGRQQRISWATAHLCLRCAYTFFLSGQYETAHEYLSNALSYDARAAFLDAAFAEIGIPIALYMDDKTMLAKCARLSAIDFAFRSGQPALIGPVTAAFAQMYVASQRKHEAERLLHRALEVLSNVGVMGQFWELPIAVARFGLRKDISAARRLIELRTTLPNPDVARACLEIFDAFAANQHKQQSKVQQHALAAVEGFEKLGWHTYAELARTLLPTSLRAPVSAPIDHEPSTKTLLLLTTRERQIVGLVLKGLTNREIAANLSISENTVETHMASIMSRFGIRSRHQLINILAESGS